jgi:alanine-glyoxylate transaminase / serine-glyoxylate transaminase / serine-pyruvate transaminase
MPKLDFHPSGRHFL